MTKIEWAKNTDGTAGRTWNPISGCSRKSTGCENCYAEKMTKRLAAMGQEKYTGLLNAQGRFDGTVKFDADALLIPLKVKKPTTWFVNSMSDLFHENVKDEWIDKIFAVMALCPQHTFQILTKRAERMRDYLQDENRGYRVAKAVDAVQVQIEMAGVKEELKPINTFPNYYISNFGIVYSSNGSKVCLNCGATISGRANKRFCSTKCSQAANYQKKSKGAADRFKAVLTPMSPDEGDQGHLRVMLYRNGTSYRFLVHRLVLEHFDRMATNGEQGCHQDGDPKNNHIVNLRWGTQSDNWEDRKRHGNHKSSSKLSPRAVENIRASLLSDAVEAKSHNVSETTIRNIRQYRQHRNIPEIPLPLTNCWLGTSCENQKTTDERIPFLLETPAAIRFLSCEPLLEEIRLKLIDPLYCREHNLFDNNHRCAEFDGVGGCSGRCANHRLIDWVIVGGESGANARPCDIEWIRSIIRQCKDAEVKVFVKQLGAKPFNSKYLETPHVLKLENKKGGDITEFPKDLQVREFPESFAPGGW